MAKIAYLDHSYHKKTLSTRFLPDILEKYGHQVDWFWDESWNGGNIVKWDDIKDYDSIVMFQSMSPLYGKYYKEEHSCVTYIPMLDQFGIWNGPLFNLTSFWEPFQGIKILNFSNSLHALVIGFGIKSKNVRYYQKAIDVILPREDLHGFVWIRREEQVNWKLISKLIEGSKFNSFHIHVKKDPGTKEISLPSKEEISFHNITISDWFDDKSEFEDVLKRSNVFFASRMEEGIGQSFLEAFNRGQCVVAANNGTMNEYITHGVTGLLYDCEYPEALDFSNFLTIGKQGKIAADIGFQQWKEKEDELVSYILLPNKLVYNGKYIHKQRELGEVQIIKNNFSFKMKQKIRKLKFMYKKV